MLIVNLYWVKTAIVDEESVMYQLIVDICF